MIQLVIWKAKNNIYSYKIRQYFEFNFPVVFEFGSKLDQLINKKGFA